MMTEAQKARQREYQRQWREANRQRLREYDRRRRQTHRNQILEYRRRWRELHRSEIRDYRLKWWWRNREKQLERLQRWREANREKVRATGRRSYRAHLADARKRARGRRAIERSSLGESYVRHVLSKRTAIAPTAWPAPLVNAMREYIKLLRLCRNQET